MLDTKKAEELEVVELAEDLPEYDLKRGERGVVVEVFDDPEAYDLEFVSKSGTSSKFAYSVKPHQIINIDAAAKEAFQRGVDLLNKRKQVEAKRAFRQAIELKPSYIGTLNNFLMGKLASEGEWQRAVTAMKMILEIQPDYQIARENLAFAYMNAGVQLAKEQKFEEATDYYITALSVESTPDIELTCRENLATLYTQAGIQRYEASKVEKLQNQIEKALELMKSSLIYMLRACAWKPDETRRRNAGLAHFFLAKFYLDIGRPDGVIYHCKQAQDSGLLTAELLNDYGIALVQEGELDEAIWTFERALAISPEDKVIQANIRATREIAILLGENEEARKHILSSIAKKESKQFYEPPPQLQPHPYQLVA